MAFGLGTQKAGPARAPAGGSVMSRLPGSARAAAGAVEGAARSGTRSVAKGTRNASTRLGLRERTALESAQKAVRKAKAAPTSTTAQMSQRTLLLQTALAAVERAHAEAPGDVDVVMLASELGEVAADTMRARGGEVSAHGRQSSPGLKPLQVVHDKAQEIGDRKRAAVSRQEHLDTYTAAGSVDAAAGGLQKLGSQTPFRAQAGPGDTSHLDWKKGMPDADVYVKKGFAASIAYWLDNTEGSRADEGQRALNILYLRDPSAYHAVVADVGRKYAKAHGLHDGERAATTTFTDNDFQYINPATSGSAGWLKSKLATRDHVLHGAAADLTEAELAKRQERVTAHQLTKQTADAEFDRRFLDKTGTFFKPPSRPSGGLTGAALELDQAQESDRNLVRAEGSMHSAAALSGLMKLPPYKGMVYRKDLMNAERFDSDFDVIDPDASTGAKVLVHRRGTVSYSSLASASKSRSLAARWTVGKKSMDHDVLWEIRLLDGRDISKMSANSTEVEVAMLPGTTLVVDSVEVTRTLRPGMLADPQDPTPVYDVLVRATQRSPARLAR